MTAAQASRRSSVERVANRDAPHGPRRNPSQLWTWLFRQCNIVVGRSRLGFKRLIAFVANALAAMERRGARDVYAAGLYPVCPATHDLGIRRLFDLGTLLLLLDCRPGDRVLDLGAGPGFSSEMLARLGYDVVAVDTDIENLTHNRARCSFDRTRIAGTVQVAQADAESLPILSASIDGVLGMNVLHHIPDLDSAVAELARVLKPGARAVFVEPGLDHLSADETKRAICEHGENDAPFDALEFLRVAKSRGFADAMLSATLQSPLRLLPLEEVELYLSGRHPRTFMTPQGVMDVLLRKQAYVMLQTVGQKPKTSRNPGILRCQIVVHGLPNSLRAGDKVSCLVAAQNTGDTLWEVTPRELGGFVTAGCKLLQTDGRLLTDTLGRTYLPHAVPPGGRADVEMRFQLPKPMSPGQYLWHIDLVNEHVCWFSDSDPTNAYVQSFTIQ